MEYFIFLFIIIVVVLVGWYYFWVIRKFFSFFGKKKVEGDALPVVGMIVRCLSELERGIKNGEMEDPFGISKLDDVSDLTKKRVFYKELSALLLTGAIFGKHELVPDSEKRAVYIGNIIRMLVAALTTEKNDNYSQIAFVREVALLLKKRNIIPLDSATNLWKFFKQRTNEYVEQASRGSSGTEGIENVVEKSLEYIHNNDKEKAKMALSGLLDAMIKGSDIFLVKYLLPQQK